MADEQQEQESPLENASPEDLIKEIRKLRKESASARVRGNELQEKASAWENHLNAQKTEYEKLTDAYSKATNELNAQKAANAKLALQAKYHLGEEDLALLSGDMESMEKLAARLAAANANSAASPQAKPTDFFGGERGKAVTPGDLNGRTTFGSFLHDMARDVDARGGERTIKFT